MATVSALELADPTRPPGAPATPAAQHKRLKPHWFLSSTLIANQRRHAIINGQIVTKGQYIQQAKVVSIHPNEVWLEYKQKRFRIRMLANKIKDFSNTADK